MKQSGNNFKILGVILISTLFLGCGNYSRPKMNTPSGFDFGGGDNDSLSGDGEMGPPMASSITFAEVKEKIFQPHCISCHTGRHTAYEDYAVVKIELDKIIERVATGDTTRRMPKGGAALPDDLIQLLVDWSRAGAPEFTEANNIDDNGSNNEGDNSGDTNSLNPDNNNGTVVGGEVLYSFA